jgi:carbon monoxide dehydrogenase subunit G
MSRAEHTVTIRRRPDQVFAFLTDPDNTPMWQATVLEVERLSDSPIAVGSRFVDVRRFLGKSFTSTFEVVELDAPRRSAVEVVEGPVQGEASYDLREVPGGTEVRFAYRMDAAGFYKLAEHLITRVIVRDFEASLGHLKDLLEMQVAT